MCETMEIAILTLFPEYFRGPLQASLIGDAVSDPSSALDLDVLDIRDFTEDDHRRADDSPYGGGAGMVLKPGPTVRSIEYARRTRPEAARVLLTPQGERLDQSVARELADQSGVILVCGRYEGVDERVREGWIDRELSIGDFVLAGGEVAALAVVEAVARLLPGVLGNRESLDEESFADNRLEYPQYTRPRTFRGREVPDVLLSGDHERIAKWRRERSRERTRRRRPDLIEEE